MPGRQESGQGLKIPILSSSIGPPETVRWYCAPTSSSLTKTAQPPSALFPSLFSIQSLSALADAASAGPSSPSLAAGRRTRMKIRERKLGWTSDLPSVYLHVAGVNFVPASANLNVFASTLIWRLGFWSLRAVCSRRIHEMTSDLSDSRSIGPGAFLSVANILSEPARRHRCTHV